MEYVVNKKSKIAGKQYLPGASIDVSKLTGQKVSQLLDLRILRLKK